MGQTKSLKIDGGKDMPPIVDISLSDRNVLIVSPGQVRLLKLDPAYQYEVVSLPGHGWTLRPIERKR